MSIYQCLKIDIRYKPPIRTIVYEAKTEKEAIEWLENNSGGIYRNLIHNFDCNIQAKELMDRSIKP